MASPERHRVPPIFPTGQYRCRCILTGRKFPCRRGIPEPGSKLKTSTFVLCESEILLLAFLFDLGSFHSLAGCWILCTPPVIRVERCPHLPRVLSPTQGTGQQQDCPHSTPAHYFFRIPHTLERPHNGGLACETQSEFAPVTAGLVATGGTADEMPAANCKGSGRNNRCHA